MDTVIVEVKVKLVVKLNDSGDIGQVIDEMEHLFSDTTGLADIEDSEILDYEVTYSN